MRKMRKAHLWIGLIASILIFMESITGLIMNEPWLIGQASFEGGRGQLQKGQFGFSPQGNNHELGQFYGQSAVQGNPPNFNATIGIQGGEHQGIMGFIRGLHEGKIGETNVKWLIDLAAITMIFLTGSGIYLSMKILIAEKKRKNRRKEKLLEV